MKNLKEFKELIERYETISLEEIQEKWSVPIYPRGFSIANKLTGFSKMDTCTLCVAVDGQCGDCVYESLVGCREKNKKTYERIAWAESPAELLSAFRDRATHLKEQYKTILSETQE